MKYRAEIDGLRALAVVPVIFFHAGFELFSGGFVGVDVFFVISGYLITTILVEDIANNRFSIVNFYERRARRILPALLFVLLVTYAVSYFIYLPSAHKVVGQYVVTSVLSVSNILLYLRGNEYFGIESGFNPLFHTWSLGVEEQFYVFFPVFLCVVWRFGRTWVFWLVCTIALGSILISELGWRNFPTANFYLLPTRAWELLAGSIAAFIVQKQGIQKNNALALLGLAAIVFSIFFYDETTPFPSVYSLVPVFGVVLLVIYADKQTMAARLLSAKPFVAIGLISYSAYLWHLPIQIYFDYIFSENNLSIYYSLICLVIASYISYRFVERPFRTELSRVATFTLIVLTSVMLIALGVIGYLNGGYPNRTEMFSKLQVNNGWGLRCNGNASVNDSCATDSNPDIAVLGNSYAMTWVNSLRSMRGISVVQLTQDSCAIGFVDVVEDVNSLPCKQFYEMAATTILDSESINTVIISSPFNRELSSDTYIASLISLLERFHPKDVIVIGPTPSALFSVGECFVRVARMGVEANCDFNVLDSHYEKIAALDQLLSRFDNIKFYDITDIICPSGRCEMSPQEGLVMYIDRGHLSVDGADYVFRKMNLTVQ